MLEIMMGGGPGDEDEREIDVEVNNDDLKGLSIGDEVVITITGLVEKLAAGRDVDDTEAGFECPACIKVHIQSHKVKRVGPNQFDKLIHQEEEEDEEGEFEP